MLINCHSYYSLRYGTISEQEILQMAIDMKLSRLALTDINNTSACLNFVRMAQVKGISPILGIDFRQDAQQLWLGLAKNNEGFYQLNSLLSHYKHSKIALPQEAPHLSDVIVIYPLEQVMLMGKTVFAEHEYIGIHRREVSKLAFSAYSQYRDKLVALNSCTFRHKKDFNTHRLLRAIDNNVLLSKLPKEQEASPDDLYLSPDALRKHYEDYPHIISNTEQLLDECSIDFDFSDNRPHQNKLTYSGNTEEDIALLKQLCDKGLHYRYDKVTEAIQQRIAKEVDMIIQMDFVPFFLVNWDIIHYAKQQGYFHVGRGSGANSIVAYLLGITDVDPIALDLYFERFMNLYRSSPPDFDIDFSWRDRADVTRYIFERFGDQQQVALLATYNTFKHSAAVRELGKVFGLPKHEIDKLSKGYFDFKKLDKLSQLVIIYAQQLDGMPNYLSIHAGGIIISERPIHYFTATDLPPKGFPTTQFDMVIAEDVGLYKYDILGQRGLGKIKDAIALVEINQPNEQLRDIHNIQLFIHDTYINEMVSRAECIGCFYVESPAMRMLLHKLSVDSYLGLVAASSIIRPGVAQSGMMREYIWRHKDPERRKSAHPILQKIMPDTYGVMVYQEDVIKVAHYFAGLTLAEADVLRRGMSGKYRSRDEFMQVKHKFVANCRAKGYADETTLEVWRQIESFAGYAFAKGHSASYAVESYQSLYLKAYYPLEYMVAVINNGGGFYRAELYVHEARRCGGNILAPCVNRSHYPTWLYGKDIYLGLHMLQGLESNVAQRIIQERRTHGEYTSLEQFLERVPISIEQLSILVRIGAFRFTGMDKRSVLWKAYAAMSAQPYRGYQQSLFDLTVKAELPKFEILDLEDAFDEIELLGFALSSPFALLKHPLPQPTLTASKMAKQLGRIVTIYGYLITIKNTKTSNKKHMQFGTFLDVNGDWIDTVHFPPVVARYPYRGKGIYRLTGKVVEEFGYYTLEIQSQERLAYIEDVRYAGMPDKKNQSLAQRK